LEAFLDCFPLKGGRRGCEASRRGGRSPHSARRHNTVSKKNDQAEIQDQLSDKIEHNNFVNEYEDRTMENNYKYDENDYEYNKYDYKYDENQTIDYENGDSGIHFENTADTLLQSEQ
jgi:hypothetical protein